MVEKELRLSAGTIIACLGLLWLLVAVTIFAASVFGALLQPRIHRPADPRAEALPVTLILPVKLLNPGFDRAQRSAFTQSHPEFEVLVGMVDPAAPARMPMEGLVAASAVPARLVLSDARGAMSPKLDTLVTPIEQAAHDMIVTKDSNITFAPDTLQVMLRGLTPDVGLVCAVPVAVRAQSFAGCVEAVLINRDARLLLTAAAAGKGVGELLCVGGLQPEVQLLGQVLAQLRQHPPVHTHAAISSLERYGVSNVACIAGAPKQVNTRRKAAEQNCASLALPSCSRDGAFRCAVRLEVTGCCCTIRSP